MAYFVKKSKNFLTRKCVLQKKKVFAVFRTYFLTEKCVPPKIKRIKKGFGADF